jgi:hypothetical protein
MDQPRRADLGGAYFIGGLAAQPRGLAALFSPPAITSEVRRLGKGASRRAHHNIRAAHHFNGGHASLCQPYEILNAVRPKEKSPVQDGALGIPGSSGLT